MKVWSETEVVCDGITVSDRRAYRNHRVFTSLLRPLRTSFADGSASALPLVPTLKYLGRSIPGDGVEYDLTISEACIYHLPGAFGDLAAFVSFAASEEDKEAASAVAVRLPLSEYIVSPRVHHQSAASPPTTKAPPGPRMSTKISILRPHYVLVDDTGDLDALAVVLRCDADITFDSNDPKR